eukprot:1707293-Rhodomonas_salina.1
MAASSPHSRRPRFGLVHDPEFAACLPAECAVLEAARRCCVWNWILKGYTLRQKRAAEQANKCEAEYVYTLSESVFVCSCWMLLSCCQCLAACQCVLNSGL